MAGELEVNGPPVAANTPNALARRAPQLYAAAMLDCARSTPPARPRSLPFTLRCDPWRWGLGQGSVQLRTCRRLRPYDSRGQGERGRETGLLQCDYLHWQQSQIDQDVDQSCEVVTQDVAPSLGPRLQNECLILAGTACSRLPGSSPFGGRGSEPEAVSFTHKQES